MKTTLITDVDNTLFDWVDVWYRSFSALLNEVERVSGISREKLIPEIKKIHQQYGTSEYAFLLESLPSLINNHPGEDILNKYDSAIHAFRKARKESLKLYDGVEDTLQEMKLRGIKIIAFTESMSYYSRYRFTKLGLDGLVDVLYSPADHCLPSNRSENTLSEVKLIKTRQMFLDNGTKKPNPEILKFILEQENINVEECVYIGDSLPKDIEMAQSVNMLDVYAHYGKAHDRAEYELLKAVTHWTDEDVKYEESLKMHQVNPTIELNSSFSELLKKIKFIN